MRRAARISATFLLAMPIMAAISAEGGNIAGKTGMASLSFADFAQLQRPNTPNTWLIGPPGFLPSPDEAAPIFAVVPLTLRQAWKDVIESEPRTRIVAESDDALQIEAEQKTAVFGFVDKISVRILPLADGRSTLVAYSRSQVGYWDLGTNRRRLRGWLAALADRVGQQSRSVDRMDAQPGRM